jgi:hypothetical protein
MSQTDDAVWAAHTARPRTAASAVVAARLSDTEAKVIRLDCHDHRRRRGIGVGAAVLALGSAVTTGTPAARTTMTETAPNGEPNEEPAEEPTAAGLTPRRSNVEIGIEILEKTWLGSASRHVTYGSSPRTLGHRS